MAEEEKYFLTPTAEEINDILNRAATKPEVVQDGNIPLFSSGRDLVDSGRNRDSYALALKTTDGPAASIEIYPDEGSNIVVTAHGYTEQSGSGDPSPENVRPIKVGGQSKWIKQVFDPDLIQKIQLYNAYLILSMPYKADSPYGKIYSNVFRNVYYSNALDSEWTIKFSAQDPVDSFFLSTSTITDVEQAKKDLLDLYNSGNPAIIWYLAETERVSEQPPFFFGTQVVAGENYIGAVLPTTEPICEGDYVVSLQDGQCVEYHANFFYSFTGEENMQAIGSDQIRITIPVSSSYYGLKACSHGKQLPTNAAGGLFTYDTTLRLNPSGGQWSSAFPNYNSETRVDDFRSWIIAQAEAGTPFTVVFQRSTPVSYTHDPVPLIAKPDSTGKVTVSGEKTVSATYNKSLSHAFSELKSAIISLGANMQGGL